MRVIALRSSQNFNLSAVPHFRCSYSSSLKQPYSISFPISRTPCGKFANFFHRPVSFPKARSGSFGEFFSAEEVSSQIEELMQKFNLSDVDDHYESGHETASVGSKISIDMKCPRGESLDVGSLRPFLYGFEPESPDWCEGSEIDKASIERKANSVELPLSLRLIKMKRRLWEESFRGAGELTTCSMKKAFSYMVYILRELQTCALSIREGLYYEDLQEITAKMQREMNVTFVWLFQRVFSSTPTLMVFLMILLANYTAKSMDASAVSMAAPFSMITETLSAAEDQDQQRAMFDDVSVVKRILNGAKVISPSGSGTKDRKKRHYSNDVPNEINGVPCLGNEEFTSEEELALWNSVLEEASRMQAELRAEALDRETVKQFVSPLTVELEENDYVDYFRTDLEYQMGLALDPNNPLLLSNYAQFLYLVYQDHNR